MVEIRHITYLELYMFNFKRFSYILLEDKIPVVHYIAACSKTGTFFPHSIITKAEHHLGTLQTILLPCWHHLNDDHFL